MTELAILAADPSSLESARDPGEFVVLACQRAKEWLIEAVQHGDIDQIVELKSQAEAVRVYTAQKQLGKDAELAAAEIVRRAERGIGLAIRRGQELGEIAKVGDPTRLPDRPVERVRCGRHEVTQRPTRRTNRPLPQRSPKEFFGSGDDANKTYAVTDGVSDEQFEDALEEAKAEQNLSRANVVRNVVRLRGTSPSDRRQTIAEMAAMGYSSRQIAERVGIGAGRVREVARMHEIAIPADTVINRSRHHDSNRIVQETVSALEGLAIGARLVEVAELDRDLIPAWLESMRDSLRTLNGLRRQLQELR